MSDVRIDEIPLLNTPSSPLKGSASAVILQDNSTLRVRVSALSSTIYDAVVENNPSDIPVGQIAFFARNTAPEGWLVCDGTLLIRGTPSSPGLYDALYEAIGTTFNRNTDTDTTKFRIPDLRGKFLRSWQDSPTGDDAGRVFGSYQEDALKSHRHELKDNAGPDGDNDSRFDSGGQAQAEAETVYTQYTGGDETRPKNIALLACIRYAQVKVSSSITNPLIAPNSGITVKVGDTLYSNVKDLEIIGSEVTAVKQNDLLKLSLDKIESTTDTNTNTEINTIKTTDKIVDVVRRPIILGIVPDYLNRNERLIITSDPAIVAWGNNFENNLDPKANDVWPPQRVRFEDNFLFENRNIKFTKVLTSSYWKLALLSDGSLWICGYANNIAYLGIPKNLKTAGFVKINTSIKFKDVDFAVDNNGRDISIAGIGIDNKLYTWGRNDAGECGHGSKTAISGPTLVESVKTKDVKQVVMSANDGATCNMKVLFTDGTLWASGSNGQGQLGVKDNTEKTTLTQCKDSAGTAITNIKFIVKGNWPNLFQGACVSNDGKVYTCGRNNNGHLGLGDKTDRNYYSQVTIPDNKKIVSMVGTAYNTNTSYMALDEDGSIYTWGNNSYGLIGDGTRNVRVSPYKVTNGKIASVKIAKLYASGGYGNTSAFGCIDVNKNVWMAGYYIPDYLSYGDNYSSTFIKMPINSVEDMVMHSGYSADFNTHYNHMATTFLVENSRIFSFGINGKSSTFGARQEDYMFPVEVFVS
jgi:alpha-tubulin suppressor-like RCC1 family protein/microcystin-dependent protein